MTNGGEATGGPDPAPTGSAQTASGGPAADDLGPLVALFQAVEAGTMPIDQACTQAAQAGSQGQTTPQQLGGLAGAAAGQATTAWRPAWLLIRIVDAAAEAAHAVDQSPEMDRSYVSVGADLINVAACGLQEAGDIRLFIAARTAGDRAIATAQSLGASAAEGVVRQRRGSMILDCYTSGRTPANYAAEFGFWVQKALQAGDPELALLVAIPVDGPETSAAPTWPSPLAALDLAETDLRAAAGLVGPDRRGRVLKALSQVLDGVPTSVARSTTTS